MNSKIKNARIAGFLYLLIIGFGLVAQVFVRDNLVDYSKPLLLLIIFVHQSCGIDLDLSVN